MQTPSNYQHKRDLALTALGLITLATSLILRARATTDDIRIGMEGSAISAATATLTSLRRLTKTKKPPNDENNQ